MGSNADQPTVSDGTMCIAQSFAPGPTGTSAILDLSDHTEREAVFGRALEIAPAALYRETRCSFDGKTAQDLISAVVRMLKIISSANAQGARSLDNKSILGMLRLEFLADSIDSSLGGVVCLARMGVPMDSARESENAAEAVAAAAGMVARLILQGIVTSLVKTSSPQGAVATALGARNPSAAIVSNAAVAQLVEHLRASKLGDGFGTWVKNNWKDLFTNSWLQLGAWRGGGAVDRIVSEPRAPKMAASSPEPTPEPATFSDANLAAQAATLVAAAARGAPFCPV